MNLKDLKPLSELAANNGAKVLVYGPPGTGKTPMVAALPKSVSCVTEIGLSSVSNSGTPGWSARTLPEIDEFIKWFSSSREADRFETCVVDSLTELANIVLKAKLAKNKHGQKAYWEMKDYVLGFVGMLCTMPKKNIVFTAQMTTEEVPIPGAGFGGNTYKYNRPLFPGKVLEKEIPHSINEILYVHNCRRPDGVYGPAIATTDTGIALARSRCGKLDPIEPPDLNHIFNKMNA